MLRQVVAFVINGMIKCFDLMKAFVMDSVGGVNITFYHFLVFVVFIAIALRLINFVKGIQEMQTEKQENFDREQKNAYNEWLRDHPSTPRRFKK